MSLYRNQLEQWLKTISVKTERVLDLGGASNPVKNRVASFDVEEVIYIDNGAEQAKEDYMPADINLPWQPQLKGYGAYMQRNQFGFDQSYELFKFQAVFCLEVFEYVWNPVQAIQNIWELMSNDSVAYISFPAIYPVHQPWEIDYLRYTKQGIMKLLTNQGFTQIEITDRKATNGQGALAMFYSQEGMHPLKGSHLPYDIGYLVKARKLALV